MDAASHRSRIAIADRLRARRAEIEQALLARIYGVADPTGVMDVSYVEGFRAAASAAFDFAVGTLEGGGSPFPPIPSALLSQARLAASNRVSLDTVLRRYTAGHALLIDFLLEEVERDGELSPVELRHLLGLSSSALDLLLASVADQFGSELKAKLDRSPERRRAERVERLLAGEPVDAGDLGYDFNAEHLGVLAAGPGVETALRGLAGSLDRHLLLVPVGEEVVWAWLRARRPLDSKALDACVRRWPTGPVLALGEPAWGLVGWRLSHNQAKAVAPFADASGAPVVRYADLCLVASLCRDETLVRSLRQIYLDPLTDERDGGEALRETLRAYFATGRNITSAAAALQVNRQTVRNRLRLTEEKTGRCLDDHGADFEIALKLDRQLSFDRGPALKPHPPIRPLR